MNNKSKSLLLGFALSTTYGGLDFFTTLLKATSLDTLFLNSGVLFAPIGAGLLWILESIGLVSDPGMGGGILIMALSGYVLWLIIFSLLALLLFNKYA